jgi:hypothetical protein
MTPSTVFQFCRVCWIAPLLLFGSMPHAMSSAAPVLIISSPRNGDVVTSGQPLAITVTIASGTFPHGIAIMGQIPLGATEMEIPAGPIAHFTLAIASNTPPGKYAITAVSVDSAGTQVASAPIDVIVESALPPTDLKISPGMMIFAYVGQTLPLTIFATSAGGLPIDVTRSSRLIADSENSKVAIMENGMIMAVGSGKTLIHINYGLIAKTLPVSVPAFIRGDLNGDGKVDQADLNVILAAKGWTANGSNDARDLNHDGVINELDADILRSLCTHPGCASR